MYRKLGITYCTKKITFHLLWEGKSLNKLLQAELQFSWRFLRIILILFGKHGSNYLFDCDGTLSSLGTIWSNKMSLLFSLTLPI